MVSKMISVSDGRLAAKNGIHNKVTEQLKTCTRQVQELRDTKTSHRERIPWGLVDAQISLRAQKEWEINRGEISSPGDSHQEDAVNSSCCNCMDTHIIECIHSYRPFRQCIWFLGCILRSDSGTQTLDKGSIPMSFDCFSCFIFVLHIFVLHSFLFCNLEPLILLRLSFLAYLSHTQVLRPLSGLSALLARDSWKTTCQPMWPGSEHGPSVASKAGDDSQEHRHILGGQQLRVGFSIVKWIRFIRTARHLQYSQEFLLCWEIYLPWHTLPEFSAGFSVFTLSCQPKFRDEHGTDWTVNASQARKGTALSTKITCPSVIIRWSGAPVELGRCNIDILLLLY